jgi:hypothetical protein
MMSDEVQQRERAALAGIRNLVRGRQGAQAPPRRRDTGIGRHPVVPRAGALDVRQPWRRILAATPATLQISVGSCASLHRISLALTCINHNSSFVPLYTRVLHGHGRFVAGFGSR